MHILGAKNAQEIAQKVIISLMVSLFFSKLSNINPHKNSLYLVANYQFIASLKQFYQCSENKMVHKIRICYLINTICKIAP